MKRTYGAFILLALVFLSGADSCPTAETTTNVAAEVQSNLDNERVQAFDVQPEAKTDYTIETRNDKDKEVVHAPRPTIEEKINESEEVLENNDEALLKLSCKEDQDCTIIEADCCGCRQGGSQKAIHKSQVLSAKTDLKARCDSVACMAVISNHKSCKQKSRCKSGSCVLE